MPKNWDQSVFDRTLQQYSETNRKRTLPEILNTKGWFIARAATWFTKKADKSRIETSLGRIVSVNRLSTNKRTGFTKVAKRRELVLRRGNSRSGAPLAALIVTHRLAGAGKRSPFYRKKRAAGIAAMNAAIQKMINLRLRAVAFLKSGWLEAIRKLGPYAVKSGAPAVDASAKQIGRAKGDAKPATPGFVLQTVIINLAFGNRTSNVSRQRALGFAERGLQRAFDNETKSMNEYIEKRMKPDADKFNAQQRN